MPRVHNRHHAVRRRGLRRRPAADRSSSTFRAVADQTPVALMLCTRSGRVTYVNHAAGRLLDRSPEQLTDKHIDRVLDVVDGTAFRKALQADTVTDSCFAATLSHRRPPVTCQMTLSVLPDRPDQEDGILLSLTETTDVLGAATIGSANNDRYRLAVERANDVIFNIDLAGHFTFVNPTACSLTGYQEDELVGRHFLTLICPDARRAAEVFYRTQVQRRIASTYYEYPIETRDGQVRWLGQFVQLILDGSHIVSVQAIARDITEQRRIENALRTSEERLRAVVSSAPLILWATDTDGRLTLCAGEGLTGLGLDGDDLIGHPASQLIDDPALTGHIARAQAGETFQVELRAGDAQFDAWFSPALSTDGDVTGVIGVVADITERERLRSRLGEFEKAEAIGQLAAGVAHDFNNQLTAVLGYAELLERTFEADDPRRNDVQEITKAGQRAASITEQLLAYGRRQPRRPRIVSVNDVIRGIEPLLRRLIPDDVEFDISLGSTDPVRADPTQIERMLLNLVLNARDAMSGAGRLLVSTSMTHVNTDDRGAMSMPADKCVQIAVADSGDGMSAETRERVFEPFFTTKEFGKGTGLGLASVYGMIKQNGGHIAVTSALGTGTTFTILLPIVAGRVEDIAPDVAPRPDRRGSETILVVDDDPSVRTLTRESLIAQGYRVLDAPDAVAALELVASRQEHIDLLLTDVVMPLLNGRELAKKLRAEKPTMRVLFTTGHRNDETLQRRISERRAVLHKPYVPSQLLRRVREVLDGAPSDHARRATDSRTQ